MSDEKVRQLLQQGDINTAVEWLLDAHAAAILSVLRSVLVDRSRCEDAFQDCALKVFDALPSFRWESKLSTWLYRIARNTAHDHATEPFLRRGRRLTTLEQEALLDSCTHTVTKEWLKTEIKAELWEKISKLKNEDRLLFSLRLGQGLSWREIAEIELGTRSNDQELRRHAAKLRKRFERIKSRLREQLSVS